MNSKIILFTIYIVIGYFIYTILLSLGLFSNNKIVFCAGGKTILLTKINTAILTDKPTKKELLCLKNFEGLKKINIITIPKKYNNQIIFNSKEYAISYYAENISTKYYKIMKLDTGYKIIFNNFSLLKSKDIIKNSSYTIKLDESNKKLYINELQKDLNSNPIVCIISKQLLECN